MCNRPAKGGGGAGACCPRQLFKIKAVGDGGSKQPPSPPPPTPYKMATPLVDMSSLSYGFDRG